MPFFLDIHYNKTYNLSISFGNFNLFLPRNTLNDMNKKELIKKIPNTNISRDDIYQAVLSLDNTFNHSELSRLINQLIKEGLLYKIKYNQYTKESNQTIEKDIFTGNYSNYTKNISNKLSQEFPFLNYQIWELSWLNEFTNHLLGNNIIFIDSQKDGCEFIVSSLIQDENNKVLLKPIDKELNYYISNNTIIVNTLISETPVNALQPHEATLEKIIVDLFASKTLNGLISKADYPNIFEEMFHKYNINTNKLLRYARRRNKEKEIIDFFNNYTDIKL